MILSLVGLAVLVAVVGVGAYWLFTNVSFKSVKKENENE
jgi:hypothetical protein